MSYFTEPPRHPLRLSAHDREAGIVFDLVDVRNARRLSERPARFGEHLQRAHHCRRDENSGGLLTGVPRQRSVYPGQVDARAPADDQPRSAIRNHVRLAAGRVPGRNHRSCRRSASRTSRARQISRRSFRGLSAVYDLFGDGKTALKFAASRYDQPITLQNVLRLNPLGATMDTRRGPSVRPTRLSGCDLNRDLVPQLNELGVSSGFTFGQNNRYDADLEWPNSTELSVEFQRQIFGNIVLSRPDTHIASRGATSDRETWPSRRTPTFRSLLSKRTAARQVTVYNQDPALRGKTDVLWDNDSALDTNFNGADFTVTKRLSNNWSLAGGASFGETLGRHLSDDERDHGRSQQPELPVSARALRQRRAVVVSRLWCLRASVPDHRQRDGAVLRGISRS